MNHALGHKLKYILMWTRQKTLIIINFVKGWECPSVHYHMPLCVHYQMPLCVHSQMPLCACERWRETSEEQQMMTNLWLLPQIQHRDDRENRRNKHRQKQSQDTRWDKSRKNILHPMPMCRGFLKAAWADLEERSSVLQIQRDFLHRLQAEVWTKYLYISQWRCLPWPTNSCL